MKTRIIVLICAAMIVSSCCGNRKNSQADEACCSSPTCGSAVATTCSASCSATCGSAGVKKIISAQVFIKPDKVDAFLAATKDLVEKSRAEEGCISYTLYQDPQDRTKFLFFEEWKNQAAVDYHFSTEHFIGFGSLLDEIASAPPVITIFDSIKQETL